MDDRDEFVEALKSRYESLKGSTERSNSETHWQEVAELVAPRKLDFVGLRTPGEKKMSRVYDPTGINANEMLAAGLHGMATNPSSKWFSLRMVQKSITTEDGTVLKFDESPAVQKYLADVEEIMWARLYQPGTNFTTSIHEMYLDLGAFGTAILFVSQRDDGGLIFECRPLAECIIAENADGRVDTVMRKTDYTVRQMKQMADTHGWKISDSVMDKCKDHTGKQMDDPVTVIHAVFPRSERQYGKKDKRNKPWASIYFEKETGKKLEESGFDEFPYLVARWSKYSGEVYGRSPAMTALPDLKMLQAMTLAKIKLIQKAADPPLWLKDDGVVGQTRTIPGGINYWRGNPSDGVMLQPVSLQGIQFLVEDIMQLREQILRTFFADIMRMTDRANMTATEVVQRTSEQMRLFGPLIGRLESEVLGPLVERIFGILTRLNLLPIPPREIQDQEFTVEYVSPIATAQKQTTAQGILQAMQVVAGLYGPEAGVQVVMGVTDPVKVARWAWDLFNNDPYLLKDEEAVEEDKQRALQQQQLQMAQPAADILQKGAGAVRDISQAQGTPGGVDLQGLLARFSKNVEKDPQAQAEMAQMMNGEMPAQ
jgi:hypothetical protein